MPTVAEALQIGWKQHQTGNIRQAENVYRQVLQVAPKNENAWCFLGMACHDQGRYREALDAYHKALEVNENFPVALSNMGNTLKQLGELDEAIASCRKALEFKPDYSTAYNNLGVALVAKGDLEAAAESFEEALRLMPNDAVAQANLGAALVRQGKFEEGTARSRQALDINPKYAEAHKNLAIVWLLLGDFERGWPEYEWRWNCAGASPRSYDAPLWDGSDIAGRTILIYAEQGIGDTIHFSRYAQILQGMGARVVLAAQKPLLKLLASCPGVDHLCSYDGELPKYDVAAPLMSLPGIFKTTLEEIPADIPYLRAESGLVERWREKLEEYPGFRIGIAWQGSPEFHADRQRSLPLRMFEPLSRISGVRLFSLQKGHGVEQISGLRRAFEVVDFGDELDGNAGAFMDTAAIMMNMDLIVTSDTSVPHLSGALGVPTWMALTVSPDWRWLLKREDSPWYPSLRLFRQERLGEWEPVFDRIASELEALVAAGETVPPVDGEDASDSHENSTPEPSGGAMRPLSPSGPRRILSRGFNSLHRCRHGLMLFNKNDIYIGRSLERYGEFSEGEVELFQRIIGQGDVVVEAGANIGAHTVVLAQLVGPQGRVFAFEPQRVVFQTLCANIALNGLANVDCRPAAVGSTPGEIIVPHLDYGSENNFGGLGLGQYKRGEPVPVATIDSLELEHCHFIKIDVEGMEQAVLEGARETISRCRPALYVENDRQEHSASLIEFIMSLGYKLYWHTPPLFRENNFYGESENIFGRIASVNMMCVDEKEEIDDLRRVSGPDSDWHV